MAATTKDQPEIEQIRAAITKLIAETMAATEREPLEALKLDAEALRLRAEAAKIQRELRWLPWAALALAVLALVGVTAVFY